jgi:lipopolysaccharide transport system ATP-binding protein
MTDIAIRCEGISKEYRLGERESYKALRDVLTEAAAAPFRRLRSKIANGNGSTARNSEAETLNSFWALDDVSFAVKRGEVVGIIGRNGAGKSTLLKILSRITKPTRGHAEIRGRVGSLLEVGTGFHAELSGRENIYLNAAILGMRKAEIKRRFDEIVAFAEVEKFIDTPVKRYSSGMYVRLAFAVAAHMETEILIVDEVLAVGDAQFQKKCLGMMSDVARHGRTILFVSHNMAALRTLCSRGIVISKGRVIQDTDTETAIREYLVEGVALDAEVIWNSENPAATDEIRFLRARILDERNEYASVIDCRKEFSIVIEYEVLRPITGLRIGFFIRNAEGVGICGSNDPQAWINPGRDPGIYQSRCVFPGYVLNSGRYSLRFAADAPPRGYPLIVTPYTLSFSVADIEGHGTFSEGLPGVVRPKLQWQVRRNGSREGASIEERELTPS